MLGCGVRLYCNVCLLGSLRCGCFVRRFLVLDFFFVFSILIMCGESWALSLGFLLLLIKINLSVFVPFSDIVVRQL